MTFKDWKKAQVYQYCCTMIERKMRVTNAPQTAKSDRLLSIIQMRLELALDKLNNFVVPVHPDFIEP